MIRATHRIFELTLGIALLCAATRLLAQDAPKAIIEELPEKQPAWLAGYRVRYPLRIVGDPATQAQRKSVIARLPTGGWLKPDGSDISVQNTAGQAIPVTILSHDPKGDTIIQFARSANDKWYWAYASNPSAPAAAGAAIQEGLVAEYRDWAGDNIDSWATVVDGLKKSDNVIGNCPLVEVISNYNAARPNNPRNFAASYRGYLNIKTAGQYRFLVNAQDAAFLFVDGLKVFERPGANERLTGSIPIAKNGTLIDLTVGIHPFEIHHVVGNNQASFGYCAFFWIPPGVKAWTYVPADAFAQGMYATVADVQESTGAPIATIGAGVDDVLVTISQTLYLERFEAQGATSGADSQIVWDFGDGTSGVGKSISHVYFKDGPYVVKLKSSPNLPPFERTIVAWNAPVVTSPFSVGNAVKALEKSDWKKLDPPRLKQVFGFLQVCEQSDHWPFLETLSRHLLSLPNVDVDLRASAYVSLMESLARQGKGVEALQQLDVASKEFSRVKSIQVRLKLEAADINFRQLRDLDAASKQYKEIIEESRRVEIPEVRIAAIHLGDLYTETGEMTKAGEAYRAAGSLGGTQFQSSAQTDAITRGAMLRVAEQRLRAGDIRQTRQLMEKIEINYPEQKLEGLYRFLRAEADRFGGRYEDAIDNYQILLKLPQWAGYRSKALFGIADSYFRAGNDAKTIEWLDTLEQSFPTYFDEQKLPNYRRTVERRLSRVRAATIPTAQPGGAVESGRNVAFTGFNTSFEPADPGLEQIVNGSIVRGLAMGGSHLLLIEAIPASPGFLEWRLRMRNITSYGYYWIELWQRESLNSFPAGSHAHLWLYGNGQETDPERGLITIAFNYTNGQWRKLGYLVRAPLTQDGLVAMSMRLVVGAMELDSLSIKPVSDRQFDQLANFTQGVAAQ